METYSCMAEHVQQRPWPGQLHYHSNHLRSHPGQPALRQPLLWGEARLPRSWSSERTNQLPTSINDDSKTTSRTYMQFAQPQRRPLTRQYARSSLSNASSPLPTLPTAECALLTYTHAQCSSTLTHIHTRSEMCMIEICQFRNFHPCLYFVRAPLCWDSQL